MSSRSDRQVKPRLHRGKPRSRGLPCAAGLLLTLLGGAVHGCSESWRPSFADVQPAATSPRVDLAARTPAKAHRSVYLRRSLRRGGADPQRYQVICRHDAQQEGAFASLPLAPLQRYFAHPGIARGPHVKFPWPLAGGRNAAGLMLRFEPPVRYLPQVIDVRQPHAVQGAVRIFNPQGREIYTGKLGRDVRLEGFETTRAGGRTYRACVRLHAETRLQVPWLAQVSLTEYIWLAPKTGIVRRVLRVRGWLLIRHFDSAFEDELVEFEDLPGAAALGADATPPLVTPWLHAILYFQPLFPAPAVAGAAIQYDRDAAGSE